MKKLLTLLPALLAAPFASASVTAVSPTVGGETISIPASSTASLSLPLLHASAGSGEMVGIITGVGSNYIDAANANWTAGALSNTAIPYYIRIKTGASSGRIMLVSTTANTSTRVFLSTDGVAPNSAGGVVPGDEYELVLADTLSSLFGSSTLQGGPDINTADNIWVWSSTSWQIYYYNSTRSEWERASDVTPTNRGNQVLRPDRGIMIVRNAPTALKFYVAGRVPDTAPRYFHSRPGVTFLSTGSPTAVTLGNLNLQNAVPGWTAGTNIATALADADYLQIWSSTSWLYYYYDSGYGHWRRTSDVTLSNRDTISIPTGRPIMIVRQGVTTGQNLILLPAPPST
ncbi:MAG TPA: hypothetical protein VHD61_06895 [Lacunisphaera sp.]|nr:hypothetical protein [Lacunisphaera sp.]